MNGGKILTYTSAGVTVVVISHRELDKMIGALQVEEYICSNGSKQTFF